MRVLRRYQTETAEYAQVEMPDGSRVEFKAREMQATDATFMALAEAYWLAEQARINPQPTIAVEGEDGYLA